MRGGCDRGFCVTYYKLSYRRKFIRTIWMFVIGVALIAGLLFMRPAALQKPVYVFVPATILTLVFVLQAGYTYSKWQAEKRDGL
jgi:hypothetical protein